MSTERQAPRSKNAFWATLSLFASFSTLLCCALPALLVSLGMGGVVAGLVAQAPGLIWLSAHKIWVFLAAAAFLIGAGIALKSSQGLSCPHDPQLAKSCARLRKISVIIYGGSILLYLTGFIFAFLIKYFL